MWLALSCVIAKSQNSNSQITTEEHVSAGMLVLNSFRGDFWDGPGAQNHLAS